MGSLQARSLIWVRMQFSCNTPYDSCLIEKCAVSRTSLSERSLDSDLAHTEIIKAGHGPTRITAASKRHRIGATSERDLGRILVHGNFITKTEGVTEHYCAGAVADSEVI